jgi:nucleotide-binding universal stress UspA family protein
VTTLDVLLITEHPLSVADLAELDQLPPAEAAPRSYFVAVPQHAGGDALGAVLDNSDYLAIGGRGTEIAVDHPDLQHSPGQVEEHDAERVLVTVLRSLRDAGHHAQGMVTERHPLHTVHEILGQHPCDEVVVLVRHPGLAGALHHDLAAQLAKQLDVPVLRLKAHLD